jgi:hypothetical protein
MDFETMDRFELCRRSQATESLHAFAETEDGKKLRIVTGRLYTAMSNFDQVDRIRNFSGAQSQLRFEVPVGVPYVFVRNDQAVHTTGEPLLVNTKGGGTVYLPTMTVEGKDSGPATQRAAQAKMFGPPMQLGGVNEYDLGSEFYRFLKPLKPTIE